MQPINDRLVTTDAVVSITSRSRRAIYRAVAAGTFPAPRKAGRRTVWLVSEIQAWMAALPRADFAKTVEAPTA